MPDQSSVPVGNYINQFVGRTFDQINYTGRDFFAFKDSVINYLSVNFPQYFQNFSEDDPLMMDIEAMSYVGDMLSFYTDRVFNELNPFYAREIKNIQHYIDIFNYRRQGFSAALCTAIITFAAMETNRVLPKGYKIGFFDDELGRMVPYEVATTLLILEGETAAQVTLIQGETIEEDFGVGDGSIFFRKCLRPRYVEGSMELYINGEKWTLINNFEASKQFDKVYRVILDNDYYPYVEAGDGNKGKAVPQGASIQVRYRIADGSRGNVPTGTITEFIDTYIEEFTGVTNTTDATGGESGLTVEETKLLVPGMLLSQERGVNLNDISYLVANNPFFVVRTNRIATDRLFPDSIRHYAIYVDTYGDTAILNSQLLLLKAYVESKSDLSYVITCYQPTYVAINVGVDVVLADEALSNEEMGAYFLSIIGEYLHKDNWDFASEVNASTINALIRTDERVKDVTFRHVHRDDAAEAVTSIVLGDFEMLIAGTIDVIVTGGYE